MKDPYFFARRLAEKICTLAESKGICVARVLKCTPPKVEVYGISQTLVVTVDVKEEK